MGTNGTRNVYDISRAPYSASATGDNTTASQQAIEDVYASGGGIVYVPAGSWPFRGTLSLPEAVSLVGDGAASALTYTSANVAIR